MGQRLNIIIIAEGAIDTDGNAITPDYVKDVCRFCFVLHCFSLMVAIVYWNMIYRNNTTTSSNF